MGCRVRRCLSSARPHTSTDEADCPPFADTVWGPSRCVRFLRPTRPAADRQRAGALLRGPGRLLAPAAALVDGPQERPDVDRLAEEGMHAEPRLGFLRAI